jgi:RNA ligase (TIGR02306 family)
MINRNPDLMKNRFFRWLYKHSFGKKILFFFFGKKNVRVWPEWVSKTDEERVQNMPWILKSKDPWIVTEKIDGSSATYTMKRGPAKYLWSIPKNEFYVCSRNVVFETPDKPCFYANNIYWEIAEKYHIKNVLEDILREHPEWDWVTIQGEIYGPHVQKRDYSKKEHDFAAFNFITSKTGRWNSVKAKEYICEYGIPWVPILYDNYILPDSVDELLAEAEGNSVIDNGPREGWVLRAQDGGQSFKAVSNSFLLKFH